MEIERGGRYKGGKRKETEEKGGMKGEGQRLGKEGEEGLSAPPNKNPAYGPVFKLK